MNGWYPRFMADGGIVSGAGELWLDGRDLGIRGHQPVPIDADRVVYHGDTQGTYVLNVRTGVSTLVRGEELIELAGGGGQWAGVRPSVGIVRSTGEVIRGAGQPAMAADRALIYRVDDDKIEPSICLTALAWGDGHGRIIGGRRGELPHDLTVVGPEYRPIVFDTPSGPWILPWILTMTNTTLRVRPLGASDGYEFVTGEDRNLHADAIWFDGWIHIVANDTQGQLVRWDPPIHEPRRPFQSQAPAPIPTPIPIPEPTMQIPDAAWTEIQLMHNRFANTYPATEEGARAWTKTVCEQLAYRFPSGGWCWKQASFDRPPSKDGVARQIDGQFEGWDVLSEAGKTGPRFLATFPPKYHDLSGQWPIPVTPVNHLGDGVPDEPSEPSDDVAILTQRITALEGIVKALEATVREQCLRHGDRVALHVDAHGQYVCADANLGAVKPLAANRDAVGAWETFTVERQEG